jgi:hypothetical protein
MFAACRRAASGSKNCGTKEALMPRGRSTFTKRQKEQTRQQKQREKAERRTQRKQEEKPVSEVDEMQELQEYAAAQAALFLVDPVQDGD